MKGRKGSVTVTVVMENQGNLTFFKF